MRRFFCMLLSLAVLFAAGTVYAENNETRGHHVWGSEFGEEGYLPPEAEKILEECGLSAFVQRSMLLNGWGLTFGLC